MANTKLVNNVLTKLVLVITILTSSFFYFKYGKETYVFTGDALGYYTYLPSLFIYDNFYSIEKLPKDKGIERPVLEYVNNYTKEQEKSLKGTYVNQYTYGVAAFEMPFFLIAHAYEKVIGGQANGYSISYHHALKVAFAFFALLGLFFYYKVLRLFFNKAVSTISSCLLLLGTNLFWFQFVQTGMAHSILFMLYAILIYYTVAMYKKGTIKNFIIVGFTAGVITLIRPTDVICCIIPIAYNVFSLQTLKQRFLFFYKERIKVLLAILAFSLPIIPQLIFWKKYSGSFIYYSYGGQSFDFLHPHILEGLFGFRNGWLPYSLIIIPALLAIPLFARKLRSFNVAIWTIVILHVYIAYSWWCYNYINGYGSRPMVHLYPLLVIPFAFLIEHFLSWKKVLFKVLTFGGLSFLAFVNVFLMYKAANGQLISEESNRTFYFSSLFKSQLDYNDLVVFDCEELQPKEDELGAREYFNLHDFEKKKAADKNYIFDSTVHSMVCYLGAGEEFPPNPFRDTISKNLDAVSYAKVSVQARIPEYALSMYWQPILAFSVRRGDSILIWRGVKLNNKIGLLNPEICRHDVIRFDHAHPNTWGDVSFYVDVSKFGIKKGDVVEYGIWNIGKRELFFDNLSLSFWEKEDD